MEKKNYIQPRVEETELLANGLMLPNSPTNGTYDPTKQSAPKLAPMVNNADTTAVF